jgi:hypothetical protein
VDAANEAPQPLQRLAVVEFGRVAALAAEQREAEALVVKQRAAADDLRRDQGDLGRGQFQGESVFLADLRVAPAPRPIELGDDRVGFVQTDLVDPVLIAVQRQQAAVRDQSDAFHGQQHGVRAEPVIGCRVAGLRFHRCMIPGIAAKQSSSQRRNPVK